MTYVAMSFPSRKSPSEGLLAIPYLFRLHQTLMRLPTPVTLAESSGEGTNLTQRLFPELTSQRTCHAVSKEDPPEASAAAAARALDAVCLRGAPVAGLAAQLERAGGFLDVPANPVALYSRQCAPLMEEGSAVTLRRWHVCQLLVSNECMLMMGQIPRLSFVA